MKHHAFNIMTRTARTYWLVSLTIDGEWISWEPISKRAALMLNKQGAFPIYRDSGMTEPTPQTAPPAN